VKNCCWFGVLLAVSVLGPLAYADSVTMSTGASEAFPTLGALNNPLSGQNGSLAFWANPSVDGIGSTYSQLNIGNFLTGTCGTSNSTVGSCPQGAFDGMATPNIDPNTLSYLGNGLSPVSSFYFTRDSDNSSTIDPSLFFTANTVQLGWYVAGQPKTLTPIFNGLTENQPAPADWSLANIPLGTNYGFYAVVDYGNGYLSTYFTESQFNSFSPIASFDSVLGSDSVDGENKQHFALFQTGSNYELALEDGIGDTGYEGQGDYQDSVFAIIETPEPSTFLLAGLAIAATFSRHRRMLKRLRSN
jgi:PEP-CTERM motif